VNTETAKAIGDAEWVSRRGYATWEDFCAIFEEEMDILYSLALLLTGGDEATAERCFLAALDDCRNRDVFAEWARPWSRRAVIEQAIRHVHPRPDGASAAAAGSAAAEIDESPRRLLELPPFERFVFGMAVLERYSARECATLLDCRTHEVEGARVAALEFLGSSGGDRTRAPLPAGTGLGARISAETSDAFTSAKRG
jgi:DNA-directed RNA polymerase specialized sigma24 family protein